MTNGDKRRHSPRSEPCPESRKSETESAGTSSLGGGSTGHPKPLESKPARAQGHGRVPRDSGAWESIRGAERPRLALLDVLVIAAEAQDPLSTRPPHFRSHYPDPGLGSESECGSPLGSARTGRAQGALGLLVGRIRGPSPGFRSVPRLRARAREGKAGKAAVRACVRVCVCV